MQDDDGVPAFLQIPHDERKVAWAQARAAAAARPLPPAERKYLPINDAPPEPTKS